jgi:hypothetical protein
MIPFNHECAATFTAVGLIALHYKATRSFFRITNKIDGLLTLMLASGAVLLGEGPS